MIVPLTPLSFLRRAVKLYGKKTAVICGETRFTYAEFNGRVQRLSHSLDTLGHPSRGCCRFSFAELPSIARSLLRSHSNGGDSLTPQLSSGRRRFRLYLKPFGSEVIVSVSRISSSCCIDSPDPFGRI